MQIHYEIFSRLCMSHGNFEDLSDIDLVNKILKEEIPYSKFYPSKEVANMIVKHWRDYLVNYKKYRFNERYKKPLEHFGVTKTIKVRIIGHKRKYVHCDVIDKFYRKRADFLRILKEKRTSYLEDDEEYVLDLVEIKAGAIHEHNIFELAYNIEV